MYEPYCLNDDDEHVRYVMDKCKKIGLESFSSPSGGGSDANVYNSKGIKTLNLACGVNNAHTRDEFITVKELVDITRLAYHLMLGR